MWDELYLSDKFLCNIFHVAMLVTNVFYFYCWLIYSDFFSKPACVMFVLPGICHVMFGTSGGLTSFDQSNGTIQSHVTKGETYLFWLICWIICFFSHKHTQFYINVCFNSWVCEECMYEYMKQLVCVWLHMYYAFQTIFWLYILDNGEGVKF